MLQTGEYIPEDKIDPNPIAEGTRVRVHRLRNYGGLEGRILRIPKDPTRDRHETVQMEMLRGGPLTTFLPSPTIVRTQIGERVRHLVASREIQSPMCRREPTVGAFAYQLEGKSEIDAQIQYLAQLRGFIRACKSTYERFSILPDLIGRGNIVSDAAGIWLLDFNNISGQWNTGQEVEVPLDDQGLPIFDMGLGLLYNIEKKLLTHRGTNLSTQAFHRNYCRARGPQNTKLPEELTEILVTREQLKADPFYGALRFGARREKVNSILDKIMRDRVIH